MEKSVTILLVGGDSARIFLRRAGRTGSHIEHWSGRKTRDLAKPIPKATDAIVVVLDRVSHALVRKVRIEAARRGLPIYFQKRGRQIESGIRTVPDGLDRYLQRLDVS